MPKDVPARPVAEAAFPGTARCQALRRGEAELRTWQPEAAPAAAGLLSAFVVEGRLSRGPVASGAILPSNGLHLSYAYEGFARSHRDRRTWSGWSISHGAREPTRFEMSRHLTLLQLTLDPELVHRALRADISQLRDTRGPLESFAQLEPLAQALQPAADAATPEAALAAAQRAVHALLQRAEAAPPAPAGASPRTAQRSFRRGNVVSQREFIAIERFQRVASLLAASELPLAEIALACGFCDQAHLTRAVRQFAGQSPSQLRQALRHSPFAPLYLRPRGGSRVLGV